MTSAAPSPRCIAHRGGAALGPENTLETAELAWAAGLRGFEFDIKLSADGVAFVLHDDLLERTLQARGRASSLPWSQLSRLPTREHPSAHPPSLEALAAWCGQRQPCWLNLEIKTDTDADPDLQHAWGARIAQAAANLWAGLPTRLLLSSFSVPALRGAAETAPGLERAWLTPQLPADWLEQARALGVVAIHLDASRTLPEHVAAVRASGLQLRLYTVNAQAEAMRWIELGVDAVFSDQVLAL